MLESFTAKYTRLKSGYMGQIVEWPEVITEGKTLDRCREMLKDALEQMVLAYRQRNLEIPKGNCLIEQIPVETGDVRNMTTVAFPEFTTEGAEKSMDPRNRD